MSRLREAGGNHRDILTGLTGVTPEHEAIARRLLHEASEDPGLGPCDDAWESAAIFLTLLDEVRGAYSLALIQIEHDGDIKNRLTQALRVATHHPHDQVGPADPESDFPTCSVCHAILTDLATHNPWLATSDIEEDDRR